MGVLGIELGVACASSSPDFGPDGEATARAGGFMAPAQRCEDCCATTLAALVASPSGVPHFVLSVWVRARIVSRSVCWLVTRRERHGLTVPSF